MTRAEALALATDLVDYRAKSMVSGGRQLAQFVLRDEEARQRLVKIVERLAASSQDEALVAEAMAARG